MSRSGAGRLRAQLHVGVRAALAADKDAAADRPWMNTALSPDGRAELLERAMTPDEKIGAAARQSRIPVSRRADAGRRTRLGGLRAGIARLGVPPLQESDAGLGVTNPQRASRRRRGDCVARRAGARRHVELPISPIAAAS